MYEINKAHVRKQIVAILAILISMLKLMIIKVLVSTERIFSSELKLNYCPEYYTQRVPLFYYLSTSLASHFHY